MGLCITHCGPRREPQHEQVQQRGEPGRALLRLAAAQEDVLTRDQALGLGLSRHSLTRLVEQERWQRLTPGLFLVHTGTAAWPSLAWGGVLLGGEGARLGHEAAAHAHGLIDEPPDPITVLVPHHVQVQDRSPWAFVRERPGARSPRVTGSPPRTLIADTVLDLCLDGSASRVEDWVTRAVQRRMVTTALVKRALRRRSRHPHRALLAELLTDVAQGAESPLELRYLRDVERRHGLPAGLRQVVDAEGTARRDVLYVDLGVVVELDGRRGHEAEGAFRDMRRDNKATADGLVSLRYGFADVHGQPCVVAREVAAVLRRRGWTGDLRRCADCP